MGTHREIENCRKEEKMKEYIVKAQIKLEVEARNEDEAKMIAMEDFSDFMRHYSFADLMEVREKETKDKKRK